MVKPVFRGFFASGLLRRLKEKGLPRREAARRYQVSESSAVNWLGAFHGSGRTGPRPMGGDRRSILKPERAWLAHLIAQEKNLTLVLISERLLRERGVWGA